MIFEVNRTDFRQFRVGDQPPVELTDGQIRLGIERFAFTANNISYALSGDALDYWGFFPAEAPWGRIPAMGLSSVLESAHPDIEVGGTYFGFHPMATQFVIDARPTRSGFRDVGVHRANHAAAYTTFTDVETDPTFRAERGDEYLLLRGLFVTSFLVDDFLADNDFFGATQTLVTSASSKTSIALASRLAARRHRSIGLTSASNVDFVEGLALYDDVILYDDLEGLDAGTPSVVVDMAGSTAITARIHHHFRDALHHSAQIGATHWEDATAGGSSLPGPKPQFFFAPTQMQKRSDEWGSGELERRMGAALIDFLDGAPTWLTVVRSNGPDAVGAVYLDTLEGRTAPNIGQVLSLAPEIV